ncbi:hypothetical protein [Kitasatospora sp. NPDC093558]
MHWRALPGYREPGLLRPAGYLAVRALALAAGTVLIGVTAC